jgi:hypothetical protein
VCHVGHGRKADSSNAIDLFRQPAILACFAYFAIYTIGTLGPADLLAGDAQRRVRRSARARDVRR